MKKGFIPVVLSVLLAGGALVGCGNQDNGGQQEKQQYTVSIANKEVLTAAWTKNGASRTISIAVDPVANVQSLINDGTITIASDHPEIVSVQGKVLSAVGVGTAKITVTCGQSSDFVNITVSAPEHGTEADDPLTAEEAVAKAKALSKGEITETRYYVTGIAKTATWDSGYSNGEIHLVAGSDELILYRYVMDDSCSFDPTQVVPGMIITAYGTLQNYQGNKWEMPQGVKVLSVKENVIPCTSLTVEQASAEIEVDEVLRIVATALPETTTDKVTFESENTGVATVDEKGRVTGVAAGTANIKVKAGSQEKSVAITVSTAVKGVKTLEKVDSVNAGSIFNKSKPSAAKESVFEQKVPGETESIKVKFQGFWALPGTYENALQANDPADYIHGDAAANLYVHTIRLDIRKYVNVTVYATDDCTGTPIVATDISGTAGSDEHVVKEYRVNSKTWSVKSNYSGASYIHSVQLTVGAEPMALAFTGVAYDLDEVSLTQGQEFNAAAKVKEEGVTGVTVSYQSSSPEVVSVNAETGVAKALAESGQATITATATDGTSTFTDTMVVKCAGNNLVVAEPAVGTQYLFGLDQKGLNKFLYATGEIDGNYASVTELLSEGAKVELVTVEGGYNIKATLADGSVKYMNYTTSESGTKSYANLKFEDTASVVWKLDLEKRCVYTNVTFTTNTGNSGDYYVGTYNTNKTFSMSKTSYLIPNSTNYAAWFHTIGARPAADSVTLDAATAALEVGDTKTLVATVAPLNADEKVTWASDAEGVATVDQTGKVTAVAEGTANITATTANGKVGTCVVTVTAAAPKNFVDTTFNLGADDLAASGKHKDGSSNTTYTETIGDVTLKITDGVKMYTGALDDKGHGAIKFGTSGNGGSFKVSITGLTGLQTVKFYFAGYKANTGKKVTVGGVDTTLTKASNNGEYDEIIYTVQNGDTEIVVSTEERCLLNTVIFDFAE